MSDIPRGNAGGALAQCVFWDPLGILVPPGAARLIATVATAEMSLRLAVSKGSPLMQLKQTDYDDGGGRPVLHLAGYHLRDASVFLVNRKGPHW